MTPGAIMGYLLAAAYQWTAAPAAVDRFLDLSHKVAGCQVLPAIDCVQDGLI